MAAKGRFYLRYLALDALPSERPDLEHGEG